MSVDSYGVVVEKYQSDFGIWLLFRGTGSFLSSLDPSICPDPLHVGDIVRASVINGEPVVRRIWPFRESVWTEGDKLVARSIVGFDSEVTVNRGRWKENDRPCILLVSRDLGMVVAPVNWYNSEFFESGKCHLLAYVEYRPMKLKHMTTDESMDAYWAIDDSRISLPATPSNVESSAAFQVADRIRKVPVLIMAIQGNSMLGWSYALGDHMVITTTDEQLAIGQWCVATVIRSSSRDFGSHGCTYTAISKVPAEAFSQPEVKVDGGRITMVLTLTRTETGAEPPDAEYKLWHDYWGLPIKYSYEYAVWIAGERQSVFRAVVQVVITGDDDVEGRRVSIVAIRPAAMPRHIENLPRTANSPDGDDAFDHLDELKKALPEAEPPKSGWAESPQPVATSSPIRKGEDSIQSADGGWTNNNNNNNNVGEEWKVGEKQRTDQTTTATDNSNDVWKTIPVGENQDETRPVSNLSSNSNSMASLPQRWQDVPKKYSRKNTLGLEKSVETKANEKKAQKSGSGKGSETGKGKSAGFGEPKGNVWTNEEEIVDPAPIRDFDDKAIEKKWKMGMADMGWKMPYESEPVVIPEGEDGWRQCGSKTFGKFDPPPPPPMPVDVLLSKYNLVRDAPRLKSRRCVITKVKFNANWTEAEHIELFILDHPSALIYHRCGKDSYLKNLPEYTTVGNCVVIDVGKRYDGFYVHNEMWRPVRRLQLPMKEAIHEGTRVKSIQLIVNTTCLSPDLQRFENETHQMGQPFTILNDDVLGKIVYFGKSIDAKEFEDYTFQLIVVTSSLPEMQSYWEAKEVVWRIKKEVLDGWGGSSWRAPTPPSLPPPPRSLPTPTDVVQFIPTRDALKHNYLPGDAIAREERLQKVLNLYHKILEHPALLPTLMERTGHNYKAKILEFIEGIETSLPHSSSMRKELQLSADFLRSIYENDYCGDIFRELGAKALWKLLVKLGDNLKAFRTPVYSR